MPSAQWHNARNARWLRRAKEAWRILTPWRHYGKRRLADAFVRRYCAIRQLPDVTFRGRHLKQGPPCPRCGRQRNYPEGHFWVVVDVRHMICPSCLVKG